ncbi:peroxynitrite isomerase THAP4-like [Phymastichus coffea]|uniref:peroxynitrite isomerase THAP4-like n=1 Tax=Phymastichus coffea TaxID=108790 RepID=UPI00273B863F|nr:peroxynitrite isomerase THAP4-like [Phymastichus coffea]
MNQLPMHNALKPLGWLEGIWRTENVGLGKFPTINPFKYYEEITFTSIGQPMLNYAAQSWHPEKKAPMHREVGFLKIIPNTNTVSFFIAHNFGLTTIEEGEINDYVVNLLSTSISRKAEGSKPPAVLQLKREFKLVDDLLYQTVYMATETTPELTEHLKVVYKKQQESLCK